MKKLYIAKWQVLLFSALFCIASPVTTVYAAVFGLLYAYEIYENKRGIHWSVGYILKAGIIFLSTILFSVLADEAAVFFPQDLEIANIFSWMGVAAMVAVCLSFIITGIKEESAFSSK